MRKYAPGVGAGVFLERAVARKATGAARGGMLSWHAHAVGLLSCYLKLGALPGGMPLHSVIAASQSAIGFSLRVPAELTELEMQDSAATADAVMIPAAR